MRRVQDTSFVNRHLFPVPAASYTEPDLAGRLLWLQTPIVDNDHQASSDGSWHSTVVRSTPPVSRRVIPCLYLPAPATTADARNSSGQTGKTLIYLHGNGEDIGGIVDMLSELSEELSVGVLCPEYPGYGIAPGTPSESSCFENVRAVLDYLLHTERRSPSDLVAVGFSVGSGSAVYLAEQCPQLHALVLVAPFTSVRGWISQRFGSLAAYLISERFNNRERLQRLHRTPLLIVHGTDDEVIPVTHAVELERVSTAPRKRLHLVPGAHHNDLDPQKDVAAAIASFI